ncbi:MAG: HEAT repeat domain-containing protein [Planctomycetaceae bacterium]|nr:HEAT repeat domain-containing protein [Planctomycetaceae bacterium]
MKTLRFFAAAAVLMTAFALLAPSKAYTSEIAENFATWSADFSAADQNHRRNAQQNWQRFCQQQGHLPENQREIIRVSVEQLAKDNPVDTAVWIIRQLGTVGDATAVPALARLLTNNEVRIRDEAARALANIPGNEAENALKANTQAVAQQLAQDALIARAQSADVPRNDGVEADMPMAIPFLPLGANAGIAEFLAGYAALNDMEKAQVLSNLTDRTLRMRLNMQQRRQTGQGTPPAGAGTRPANPYLPLALDAVQSSDETLRNAGILAVGALGGPAEIPFLLEQARTGENRELAKVALARMSGLRIDTALLENLRAETDAEKFAILADVLSRRFNAEIRPILLERAKAPRTRDRLQLLQWAEATATAEHIADFVAVWTLITERGQKDRAEQIIARLADRNAEPVMRALGNAWDTPEALSLLGRIGDANTLDTIRPNRNAIHAFRTWPDAVVADDLIAFVRNTDNPSEERISALRAFIRVVSLPGTRPQDQIGIRTNEQQKLNRLIEAFELASRVEEKRLAIERAGSIRIVESLRFALRHIDDAELRDWSCRAILDLAHQTGLRRSAREEFHAALDRVLEVTTNNDFRNRANAYKAAR